MEGRGGPDRLDGGREAIWSGAWLQGLSLLSFVKMSVHIRQPDLQYLVFSALMSTNAPFSASDHQVFMQSFIHSLTQ